MALPDVLAITAAVTAAVMLGLWLLSLVRRDASIVDIYWGLGFALIANVARALGDGAPARGALATTLVTVWGLRLGGYLLWRNWGRGEDFRYAAMRRRWGDRFPWVSLGTVFALQAVLMWGISLPVQLSVLAARPKALGWLDAAGVAVWAIGLGFESIGDWQLARWKSDPSNAGKVMDRGLWCYTRHPNYFGDACVWWGLFLVACATPAGS